MIARLFQLVNPDPDFGIFSTVRHAMIERLIYLENPDPDFGIFSTARYGPYTIQAPKARIRTPT
jgi:hypothetical protein